MRAGQRQEENQQHGFHEGGLSQTPTGAQGGNIFAGARRFIFKLRIGGVDIACSD